MASDRRVFVGKVTSLTRRIRVYQTPDSFEIDDSEGSQLRRSRLFYDEVELVTHHRRIGWIYVITGAVFAALLGFVALITATSRAWGATAAFALGTLAFAAFGGAALLSPLDVLTAFGKRTHAQVEVLFRRRRAREIYDRMCLLARERQERLARELAAEDESASQPGDTLS
jgi:hypothetical protein